MEVLDFHFDHDLHGGDSDGPGPIRWPHLKYYPRAMGALTITPEVSDFLKLPHPAVMCCLRPDGFPMSVATWYDWRDGMIVVSLREDRARLEWIRVNPRVSITVLDADWYRHVSLVGEVVRIVEDVDLADMDAMSYRYTGHAYSVRTARRLSAWIQPRRMHGWDDRSAPGHETDVTRQSQQGGSN